MPETQQGLNDSQLRKLKKLKISARRKEAMINHAKALKRSVRHNNEMIKQLAKGKSVAEAHSIAVRKVGL